MLTLPGTRVLLELDLTTPPADPEADDPIARLRVRGRRQLRPTLRALHEAAEDRHVLGLVAKVGGHLSWAVMQELRRGVLEFARSGKPTLAWAEAFGGEGGAGTAAYVLASAFGQVWLQPTGDVGLLGVGIETTFLRGTLDKLGVEPQIEQRHEYKNAADVLLRTDFSPAHREALSTLTTSVFNDAVAAVAAGRGLPASRVRTLVNGGPYLATEARENGLVDQLGYRDQVLAQLRTAVAEDRVGKDRVGKDRVGKDRVGKDRVGKDRVGKDGVGKDTELLYADRWRPRRRLARSSVLHPRRGHVALVELHGGIAQGRSRRGPMGRTAGSDTVTATLRAALEDDHARAVVFHVNSPGGSAVASDAIWREVVRIRESGRPVVVAMGQVAASGGYYVSCPADVIVALPATLTGSIGVLGGKLVVRELLERIGVTTGELRQGDRALMYSPRRRFDAGERERLVALVDQVYDDFVAKVALGRARSIADIEAVARGRVWTGRDAHEIGLVDELGGLHDAVRIARERAGLLDQAPVRPARHVPALARLGKPRSSDDPRALLAAPLPALGPPLRSSLATGLADLTAALGVPAGTELRMPPLVLR